MEIQLWREMLDPYAQAVSELVTKFSNMRQEYRNRGIYCPIESISGRVKSVSSILEKMHRKEIPFDRMEEDVEDIAGVRIICQFVEDIEKVASVIEKRQDIKIRSTKDYLKNQKKSGYRSFHLIVWYTVSTISGPKKLQVEIQIRTMAMNFWATAEHSLQYKYKGELPEHVAAQLSRTSDVTATLDKEMSTVRSEIMDAEIDSQIQENLVRDILSNIESMYKLENKREAVKIQDEFYRIFTLHDIRELKRFHDQLDLLAEEYRAQNVETKKSGL
ncbi:MAG: GTP pyrophosphokinase family protein [Lachnospiraceae bacterium]|nr:GTP pyrophosphokinase family protein [Lachnospiraceae bacterium]